MSQHRSATGVCHWSGPWGWALPSAAPEEPPPNTSTGAIIMKWIGTAGVPRLLPSEASCESSLHTGHVQFHASAHACPLASKIVQQKTPACQNQNKFCSKCHIKHDDLHASLIDRYILFTLCVFMFLGKKNPVNCVVSGGSTGLETRRASTPVLLQP